MQEIFVLHPYLEVFGCHGNTNGLILKPLYRIIVQSMLVMHRKLKSFSMNSSHKKYVGQTATLSW